jgi:hypothetical protein
VLTETDLVRRFGEKARLLALRSSSLIHLIVNCELTNGRRVFKNIKLTLIYCPEYASGRVLPN